MARNVTLPQLKRIFKGLGKKVEKNVPEYISTIAGDLVINVKAEITYMQAVDTGDMRAGIEAKKINKEHWVVGSPQHYSVYVHEGFGNNAFPRPFMQTSLLKNKEIYKKFVDQIWKDAKRKEG